MSLKKNQTIVLPSDLGSDFTTEDKVLNYRPSINYEEPPEEEGDSLIQDFPAELAEKQKRLIQAINAYDRIEKLADALQDMIDKRVAALGGLEVKLDPKKDATTIAAIRRLFPEKKDPTKLNYEMYKKCLACEQKKKTSIPLVTPEMVLAATANPNNTNLGGLGANPGDLRQEITNPLANDIVDLEEFQEKATQDMFKMMEDLVSLNSQAAVKIHESTKH